MNEPKDDPAAITINGVLMESKLTLAVKTLGLIITLSTIVFTAGRLVTRLDILADNVSSVQGDLKQLTSSVVELRRTIDLTDAVQKQRIDDLSRRLGNVEDAERDRNYERPPLHLKH